MRDIDLVLASTPHDVLALSLRAALRGVAGDVKGAQADLAATNAAVRNGKAYRSRLGDADCDLEYLARGWAYCHVRDSPLSSLVHSADARRRLQVGDFASAVADFGFSASLKDPSEPYTLGASIGRSVCRALLISRLSSACRALAQLKNEETAGALSPETLTSCLVELDEAIDQLRKVAVKEEKHHESSGRRTSGAPVLRSGEDGLPVAAFPLLLLRASARTTQCVPLLFPFRLVPLTRPLTHLGIRAGATSASRSTTSRRPSACVLPASRTPPRSARHSPSCAQHAATSMAHSATLTVHSPCASLGSGSRSFRRERSTACRASFCIRTLPRYASTG